MSKTRTSQETVTITTVNQFHTLTNNASNEQNQSTSTKNTDYKKKATKVMTGCKTKRNNRKKLYRKQQYVSHKLLSANKLTQEATNSTKAT